ncbi:MAG: nucleotide exchange factor GrpE [Gammaproteobacteria bacterium]|nr:nucleotide exchange factor GrpE [Gammaproteobacteria bacterium]
MPKETDADSAEMPASEPAEQPASAEESAERDGDDSLHDDAVAADEAVASETRTALMEAETALEAARAEIESLKDQALRAAAETENVRKRADRSIENAHKYALERFVGDLLPAVDSFERAVTAAGEVKSTAGEAVDALAEGVELSLKLLLEAMERQGIEVVDPIGAPFDPKLHEAMSMVENAEAEPGSVVEVFQKGYTVNGRLTRPARVIVAREPAPEPEAADEAAEASDQETTPEP